MKANSPFASLHPFLVGSFLGCRSRRISARLLWAAALTLFLAAPAWAQAPAGSAAPEGQPQPASAAQSSQPQSQKAQAPPAEGGPSGDNGAIALPKKQAPPPPPPPEPTVKNPPGLENYSLHVNVPVVTVNVGVILDKTHQFIPNLQKDNFRVFEDGVPQAITHFERVQAPITAVLLCEFASTNYYFIYDMRNAAYAFTQQLQPDDYVAVVTYALHTHILTDFTRNKQLVMESLNSLQIPGFSETDLFDALYQTLDRLTRVPGRKYIILVSSGYDSFSKITLDKILQKIRETPDVTIFSIGTGQYARITGQAYGGMFGPRGIDYLQADNQLNTFARMTGGMSFFPRFETAMPDIFRSINASIRNQYALSYTPTNAKQDGTYRKIHVELVDAEGRPLKMQDEKHHQLKYDVIARDGYRAQHQVQ